MVRSSTVVILFDIDGTLIDHDAAEVIEVIALHGEIETPTMPLASSEDGEVRSNAITTGTWQVNYRFNSNGVSGSVKSLISTCPMRLRIG